MSFVRPLALGLVALALGSAAQALPSKTLYVQATRFLLNEPPNTPKGPITFVAYEEISANENMQIGYQIVPMAESVADELSSLPEEKVLVCDAHAFRNQRFMYVYDLSNCH
jgi:hypothetical protein